VRRARAVEMEWGGGARSSRTGRAASERFLCGEPNCIDHSPRRHTEETGICWIRLSTQAHAGQWTQGLSSGPHLE
jgi:hypothetical protein